VTVAGPAIPERWRRRAPLALAGLFAVSGVLHFVRPDLYAAIVPRALPEPMTLVHLSGLAELVCAAGLLVRAGWAGPASALLLLAIWPANLQHALDTTADPTASGNALAVAWLRLPLQVPLIWAALQARR